jgi:hypothetical protein
MAHTGITLHSTTLPDGKKKSINRALTAHYNNTAKRNQLP